MTSASAIPNIHLHDPVMLAEMTAAIAPGTDDVIVDATFGAGGYTHALLSAAPCRVMAFDRDPEARARYDALPDDTRARCTFVDAPFSEMQSRLAAIGIDGVAGVVMDLGVSSPQLDDGARGFSFRFDGPLDMRMDPRAGESAADVINSRGETELANIIYTYGEERKSRAVARAIVAARTEARIETTAQLAAIIRRVIRPTPKDTIDPCTRTFQGLRIYVNRELDELRAALIDATRILSDGGRLVVVTFHSLEDRIVKQFLQECSGKAARPSRYLPEVAEQPALYTLPDKKVVEVSAAEAARNPRARSAKLRAAVRTDVPVDETWLKKVGAQ